MNKRTDKATGKQKTKQIPLAFTTGNYILFAVAVLLIIVGYIFLSKGPADSFWSLTMAPIFLAIGYCVIVPISIFYKTVKKKAE